MQELLTAPLLLDDHLAGWNMVKTGYSTRDQERVKVVVKFPSAVLGPWPYFQMTL